MTEVTTDAVVINMASFRQLRTSSSYDATRIQSLAGLDAPPAQHFTILGGRNLSDAQIDLFIGAFTSNINLWMIEVTEKSGERTNIYRGNLPAYY